jgi:trk system potassium uptake protein TrkH
MFVGASTGSTGGGIKVLRGLMLVRGLRWRLRRAMAGSSVLVPFYSGRRCLPDEEGHRQLQAAAQLTFLWIAAIAIGVVVLLHTAPSGYKLGDVVLEVTSAQSNVGLSSGITGPTMSTWAKMMLSLNMLTGRMELIPFLLLVRSLIRRFH